MLARRCALIIAVLIGCVPAVFGAVAQPAFQTQYFIGKVVPLAGVLEKLGAKLDADAADQSRALLTDDGKIYTLVKDDSTRMFFKDPSLLNRPMRLTGRVLPQTQILQVVNVHSIRNGQLHDVFYWCETCLIRALEPGDCACCQDKMILRETAVP
jgi:hypothetical protein